MPHWGDVEGEELQQLNCNTIRMLSAEGVQAANSGHPGLPMGAADIAHVLWTRYLRVDPKAPEWINRDRFVLSAGHGSMLVYSLLHLAGFDLPLDELKRFRQLGSKTPGHPEYGHTPGVDTTTGPLGAGFSNAVGFALAEEMLAARYNTGGRKLIDHFTYVISGDGCMMEGVTSEAASLAGHLGLGKLIVFYDDNEISIEGSTDLAFTENVNQRFEAYNWHVQDIDGHDHAAIAAAIEAAQKETERPSIIVCHTTIGKGAPGKAGTAGVHGEPLGDEELAATRKALGFPEDGEFVVPQAVRELWRKRVEEWARIKSDWQKVLDDCRSADEKLAADLERVLTGKLPANLRSALPEFEPGKAVATRNAGGEVLNALASVLPELVGGSADLAPSTKTLLNEEAHVNHRNFCGRNLHFGVREHAMGNIANGMAIHGGLRPYCATFMVFADYMRPTLRLAAIMKAPTLFYFTHDSIFVGEDGPTHQPVEHLETFRCLPNMTVLRPCDAAETAECIALALENACGPTVIAMTRQKIETLNRAADGLAPVSDAAKGGYVLKDAEGGAPEVILIASGSEVEVALGAAKTLGEGGKKVRVVNMVSMELFEKQQKSYREAVLPPQVAARVAIEASKDAHWHRYVGPGGLIIGMDNFGKSGPYKELAEKYGFTPDGAAKLIRNAGLA